MGTIDMIIFGILGISTLLGFIRGFDKQVQQIGKGITGFVIVVVVIFMYSGFIFKLPFIVALCDWAQDSLAKSSVAFLAHEVIFGLIKYIVLFVVMTIILRVILSLIGGLIGSTHGGKASSVNNIFGALLAAAMSVCLIMLFIAIIDILPDTDGVMNEIRQGMSSIFYEFNPFRQLIN